MFRSVVTGSGAFLPAKLVTNDDLSKIVDTTDEWIGQRTGIRQRYIAAEDENTSDLALAAARNALAAAGLSPQQLGAQDQIASFNPTNVLLEALSGNYTSIETPGASASTEQTKETNYLQSIVSLWKSENSTTSSGSGSSASGAASSGSGASL